MSEPSQTADSGCVMDTGRWWDAKTQEWVYSAICLAEDHAYRITCPGEHEMFRLSPNGSLGTPDAD